MHLSMFKRHSEHLLLQMDSERIGPASSLMTVRLLLSLFMLQWQIAFILAVAVEANCHLMGHRKLEFANQSSLCDHPDDFLFTT